MELEINENINTQAIVQYSESTTLDNREYEKIKSYLFLLKSNDDEEREIAKKFFEKEKKEENLIKCIIKIVNNPDEENTLKLIATQLMSKFYGINNRYNVKNQQTVEISTQLRKEERNPKINYLIDALPYVDSGLGDPRLKEESNKLIYEELKKSKKSLHDYINLIPEVKISHSEFISEELKKIENNKQSSFTCRPIQTTFEGPAPNKIHDLETWNILIKRVNLSLSHLNLKNINLDLFIKFSPTLWKKYLFTLDSIIKQLEKEGQDLQEKCEDINKERKLKQVIKNLFSDRIYRDDF
jgi:hypothetical protein